MGRFAILALLVGCYSPSVVPGAPCSSEGTCPSGLMCIADRCLLGPEGTDGTVDSPADAGSDGSIDAVPDAMVDAAPPNATWSTPIAVMNVNTSSTESDPSFTANRLMVALTRGTEIYIGVRASVTDPFTVTIATALNSLAEEASPELNADGTAIYFTSERLVAADSDVYRATLDNGAWSTPVRVDPLSTTGGDEGDIDLSPDGLTMIVERDNVFYRSVRATTTDAWPVPVLIPGAFGVNPAAPSLTAAGDLYFHADSTRNLYVARKQGTAFGTPTPVTEFNTTGRDAAPCVSADERHIMFERNGEIYEAFR